MECKTVELMEAESRTLVAWGWVAGKNGERLVKGTNVQLQVNPRDLMSTVQMLADNSVSKSCRRSIQHGDHRWQSCVLYLKFTKTVDLQCSHYRHTEKLTMWGNGCINWLDCGWSFHDVRTYQSVTLWTWNICDFMCQSYINKAGKKKFLSEELSRNKF